MADAKKPVAKKKPVSKGQADAVANLMKNRGSTTSGSPEQPTAAKAPVSTYDDDQDDNEE